METEKGEMVLVHWIDSVSWGDTDWREMEKIKELKPTEIDSVGFLVADEKDWIVLAAHVDSENEHGGGEICIPRFAIQGMRRLGVTDII